MKVNRYIVFSFLFTGLIVGACSKGGEVTDDPHASDFNDQTVPVVDLNTPVQDQVFASGDTIKIEGKITDNSLYRGSIRITDDANGAVIKEQLYEIHGYQLYNFSVQYKTAVQVKSIYTVTVQFEDHGLNAGIKTVKVKVNP